MPKTILKKFKRSRIPPTKRIAIQPRDMEIFKALADYRFLDTKQIMALFPGSGGPRYYQRRLQQLFHHGYVDRPPSQLSYYRTRGQMIYALSNKGADAIYRKLPKLRGKINWQQKNREVKFPFLDHALMISDFRVVLTLILKKPANAGIKLVAWYQGQDLKDYVHFDNQRIPIAPDAFFVINKKSAPLYFFLEADRSTMTLERYLKKMIGYWQWWREGGHKKKFNINRFRVLTITISEERKENLRATTRLADEKEQGSEMFLFACEKSYNIEEPEKILKSFWQTPKNNNWHHFLE